MRAATPGEFEQLLADARYAGETSTPSMLLDTLVHLVLPPGDDTGGEGVDLTPDQLREVLDTYDLAADT